MLKLNTLSGFGSGTASAAASVDALYLMGGQSHGEAEKITFSTEISALVTTADLSALNYGMGTLSDPTGGNGYCCGGAKGAGHAMSAECEKLVYSTEITSVSTDAVLSATNQAMGKISEGSTKGYIMGGIHPGGYTDSAEKLTFSTDTFALETDADLSVELMNASSISNGSTHGYHCGGAILDNSAQALGHKLTFSTDTTIIETDANLSVIRVGHAGVNDDTNGYVGGGASGGGGSNDTDVMDKIVFSTDIASAHTDGNLAVARRDLESGSDNVVNGKGWFTGGVSYSCDTLVFSTGVATANTDVTLNSGGSRDSGGMSSNTV